MSFLYWALNIIIKSTKIAISLLLLLDVLFYVAQACVWVTVHFERVVIEHGGRDLSGVDVLKLSICVCEFSIYLLLLFG